MTFQTPALTENRFSTGLGQLKGWLLSLFLLACSFVMMLLLWPLLLLCDCGLALLLLLTPDRPDF